MLFKFYVVPNSKVTRPMTVYKQGKERWRKAPQQRKEECAIHKLYSTLPIQIMTYIKMARERQEVNIPTE